MLFTLEALQANDGDCLILHYQKTAKAKPVRRLPVQKDWPSWAILAVQIGRASCRERV